MSEGAASAREPSRGVRALLLLAVLLAAALLRWTPPERVADLRPWPDALEYEEAARSLHAGHGYLLWIGGDAYPPRYPPGTSLLIAAAMPLTGTGAGAGVRTVLACALAAVAGAYVLGRMTAGFACGLVAALLLAMSPLHVSWSRAVMSDVPASAALVWLAVGALRLLRVRAGVLAYLVFGVACGVAGTIRYAVWSVVPAACAVAAVLGDGTARTRARSVAALVAGAVIGVVPLLLLNAWLFGNPARDGYAYWASGALVGPGRALVAGTPALPDVARDAAAPSSNFAFYGRQLAGLGTLYPWSGGVLLLLGTLAARRRDAPARALATTFWLVALEMLLLHLGLLWQWDRFLLPLLPLAAVLMALSCARGGSPALRAAGMLLVATTLLPDAAARERFAPPDPPAYDVATLERIARIAEPNAAVLARTNAFAFARTLRASGSDRVWVPLQADVHRMAIESRHLAPRRRDPARGGWIRDAVRRPFSAARAIAIVEALCREGRPVYVSEQLDGYVQLLPDLKRTLDARFGLTQALPADPYAVYRVGCSGALARSVAAE